MPITVGVLALQGDFEEHVAALKRVGAAAREVRLPVDVDSVDALIIPGGESTTISRLLDRWQMAGTIASRARAGMPVWGTCAGAILIAERCDDPNVNRLRLMDIGVERNAFGRQIDSFETALEVPALGDEPYQGVFIRAPKIVDAGPEVETLCRLPDGSLAMVRQKNLLATTFHPELTGDDRLHRYFLDAVVAQHHRPAASPATMD
jgi:pyridoxal 5'-phosphate synthase pdxT subunit